MKIIRVGRYFVNVDALAAVDDNPNVAEGVAVYFVGTDNELNFSGQEASDLMRWLAENVEWPKPEGTDGMGGKR